MTPPDARTREHWRNLLRVAIEAQQAGLASLQAGRFRQAVAHFEDVNGRLLTIKEALKEDQ